jgi:hypothetical protein
MTRGVFVSAARTPARSDACPQQEVSDPSSTPSPSVSLVARWIEFPFPEQAAKERAFDAARFSYPSA